MATITVAGDLTVHVLSDDGAFEFFLPNYDPETMAAFPSASEAYACASKYAEEGRVWQPYKSPEQREQEAAEAQWNAVRAERNHRLVSCDWTQLSDAPVDAEAWATYRKDLRDITGQENPFEIVWPSKPEPVAEAEPEPEAEPEAPSEPE
jgi:hypothetical protein